jgi:NAD(P) transhydrogenase subunit alpha
VPKETFPLERRVAATPDSVKKLRDAGLEVVVERGAGHGSCFDDASYEKAGATIVDRAEALAADVVIAIRPPTQADIDASKEGAIRVSHVYVERNPDLPAALAKRKLAALALERVPRVTRAQKMDVLSSQANLAGYRAIVEAAERYQGCFGKQVTAAGSMPPARVLIIGAGVAGLAAIGAARALGAEVRAFDTRAAAREQVESMGATFLEVTLEEKGEGEGGYAKTMSKEFIEAEMALFRAQAAEVNVIVTTALVPGTKAPILVPKDVVEALAPGSVVVDLAAEQGGNCELTKPGEVYEHKLDNGSGTVSIVGYTDLVSRMASTASRMFAGNLVHLLVEMGAGKPSGIDVDLENDVIRPALLTFDGEVLPPPPKKEPSPAPKKDGAKDAAKKPEGATIHMAPQKARPEPTSEGEKRTTSTRPPPPDAKPKQTDIQSPTRNAWGNRVGGLVVISILFALGRFAPGDFLQHFTVFILACFVGWQVIWSVTPALHTPLMSVTNAISGIIIVGGMLEVGPGLGLGTWLGTAAVLFAAINVAGGFLVTQRMLRMFRRE